MNNYVALHIEKTKQNNKWIILQFSLIYRNQSGKADYYHSFVKNSIKNTIGAKDINVVLKEAYAIIQNKNVILHNYNNEDYKILGCLFRKNKIIFNNNIYNVSKKAEMLNIKKSNILNLARIFDVAKSNSKKIPSSLFKCRQLYLIGSKMLEINNI